VRERLLLLGDEGTGTLAAVRGLHAGGFETWLAVPERGVYAARSRRVAGVLQVPDPLAGVQAYVDAVAVLARRLAVAAVLPATEASLRALTGREQAFAPAVVATATEAALDRATEKSALAELCRGAGLDVPATAVVEADGSASGPIRFPAVAKPVRTVEAAAGETLRHGEVHRVNGLGDVTRLLAEQALERVVVQEYLDGRLGAICGVAWRGRLVSAVHQESIRIWPVGRGISSYAVTIARDGGLEEGVARLLAAIGWSGVYAVQFIRRGGRAYVIDVNPRLYGSTALAVAAGHNLPAIWAALVLGREPAIPAYRAGVRYRVEEDDLRALLAAVRAGRVGEALRGAVPRPHTTHAVFSWQDPAPALVTLGKLVGRLRSGAQAGLL